MPNSATTIQTRVQFKLPSMWRVIMHNDDYTPLEFVVELLQVVFGKSLEEAVVLTTLIHNTGKAQVGVYTKEIAVTKVDLARKFATQFEHPLLTVAEET
jgi:ATP-dependent Clp protease adaptor protein ClpS